MNNICGVPNNIVFVAAKFLIGYLKTKRLKVGKYPMWVLYLLRDNKLKRKLSPFLIFFTTCDSLRFVNTFPNIKVATTCKEMMNKYQNFLRRLSDFSEIFGNFILGITKMPEYNIT